MSSTYGKIFKISTFGESHGKAVGLVLEGCPAGLEIDENKIQLDLDRRKPGQSHIVT
ncbi:MAG: chorismate synthase, partial [Opitutaceae bacterium]|nr:chorismate synthase [Cytophagales bacterium]